MRWGGIQHNFLAPVSSDQTDLRAAADIGEEDLLLKLHTTGLLFGLFLLRNRVNVSDEFNV